MNRLAKLFLSGIVAALATTLAAAAPPPPMKPPVKILPPKPIIAKPMTSIVVKPAAPLMPKSGGTIIIFPQISTARSYLPVTPVRPIYYYDYSIYFRISPLQPWLLYGTTTSFWRALSTRDMLELFYGYEAIVE